MGEVGLLQIGAFLRRQGKFRRLGRPFDVVQLGSPHHWGRYFGKQPCQRNLGHGDAPLLGQLCHAADDDRVLFRSGVVFELGITVLFQAFGGFTGMFGEPPACQGAVGRHGDVVFMTELRHLPFLLPENQVVVPLDGNEFGKAFLFSQGVGLGQLVGEAVGNADIPDLARLHHPV